MPSYLSPGVYVEEVSSGARPIEGVGTALCAFVGFTERGPRNEPVLVTNWNQYTSNFGGSSAAPTCRTRCTGTSSTAAARPTWSASAPSAPDGAAPPSHATAELTSGADGARPGFTVRALTEGSADLEVEIADASEPSDDTFKMVVRQAGQPVETFDNLTTKRGANNVVTAVRQQSKLIRVEESKTGPVTLPRKGVRTPLTADGTPSLPAVTADSYVGDTSERTGFAAWKPSRTSRCCACRTRCRPIRPACSTTRA